MAIGANPQYGSALKPTEIMGQRAKGEIEQPGLDNIFKRSERSLVASNAVATPAANATICIIPGFQSQKQAEVYRLDYTVAIQVADTATPNDMAIFLNGNHYLTIVTQVLKALAPESGTVFIAPNGGDVEIRALKGDGSATYAASLVMTRMLNGYQVG